MEERRAQPAGQDLDRVYRETSARVYEQLVQAVAARCPGVPEAEVRRYMGAWQDHLQFDQNGDVWTDGEGLAEIFVAAAKGPNQPANGRTLDALEDLMTREAARGKRFS